jgi:hypothetical protein
MSVAAVTLRSVTDAPPDLALGWEPSLDALSSHNAGVSLRILTSREAAAGQCPAHATSGSKPGEAWRTREAWCEVLDGGLESRFLRLYALA